MNNKLQSTNGNVFGQYKTLLLTAAGRTELQNLILTIQKGKKAFLLSISNFKLCVILII